MLYKVPVLAPDAELLTAGHDQYVLQLPDRDVTASLTRGAAVILFFVDGVRNIEAIRQLAHARKLETPAGFELQLFEHLAEAGLVTFADHRATAHIALAGTEHICEGCGRSCEGHLVGPLPSSEALRIQSLFGRLKEKRSELSDVSAPFVKRDSDVFLAMKNGRCVFLDRQRLCIIHAEEGGDAKPSICRTFPYVRVYTEDGVRVGVRPDCFRHHAHLTRALGEPIVLDGLEGALADLPAPALERSVALPDPISGHVKNADTFREKEALLLVYLGDDEASLSGVAALLAGRNPNETKPIRSIGKRPLRRAVDVLRKTRPLLNEKDSFVADVLEGDAALAETFRTLKSEIATFSSPAQRFAEVAWNEREESYTLDCLRRLFFVRDSVEFNGPDAAVASMVLGLILAVWSADESGLAGEERYDAVCEHIVGWHRLVTTGELHRDIFARPQDARKVLNALRA